MKTLQTISGFSAKSGGTSTCTYDLMTALHAIGCNVDLLTVTPKDIRDNNLGKDCQWLKEVDNDYRTPFVMSKNARRFLENSDYNLYHCNALWMGINHDTCRIARAKKKPYIISPHGMLYPTALKVHSWKKNILRTLWYNKDIMEATCLHVTCEQEKDYCRTFGYKGPIAVIPNCVSFPKGVSLKTSLAKVNGRRQIGFLGRLHPIKKVENLLYALALLPHELQKQVSLQIMGKYDDVYDEWLKAETRRLNISDSVEFVGFVGGADKYERLSRLSALFVPSEQENFGMIVPEALICGTPVYASLGTPWEELNTRQCGWWRDNSPETIAEVIKEIMSMSENELLEMGKNGRQLMEDRYEQHKVASMMKRLYEWIINGGEKPNFVYE